MKKDEPADIVDDALRIAERPETTSGQSGTDHLMMMEGHAARAVLAGIRLADIVQESGQPEHEIR